MTTPSAHELDRLGARIYGAAPASSTSTTPDGGLFPRDDDDMSAEALDARAAAMADRRFR